MDGHHLGVRSIAVSPDGRFIYSGGYDATVRQWRVSDGEVERTPALMRGRALPGR
jgi:WD40 repeat protein